MRHRLIGPLEERIAGMDAEQLAWEVETCARRADDAYWLWTRGAGRSGALVEMLTHRMRACWAQEARKRARERGDDDE
jgi:hypothetical protein